MGMCVGNILAGVAGRRVERPIMPVVGETRTPFLATKLLPPIGFVRIELPAIHAACTGFSGLRFHREATGRA